MDPQVVLRLWWDLISRDPGPIDCQLLKSFVEGTRYVAPRFRGRDVVTIMTVSLTKQTSTDHSSPLLSLAERLKGAEGKQSSRRSQVACLQIVVATCWSFTSSPE